MMKVYFNDWVLSALPTFMDSCHIFQVFLEICYAFFEIIMSSLCLYNVFSVYLVIRIPFPRNQFLLICDVLIVEKIESLKRMITCFVVTKSNT
jgi:hypothetical protein